MMSEGKKEGAADPVESAPDILATYIPSGSENFTFLADPTVDRLMQTVISLGAEHWIVRRRLLVLEAALEAENVITTQRIEQFVPSREQEKIWEAERDAFIRRAFEGLKSDPDAAATQARGAGDEH